MVFNTNRWNRLRYTLYTPFYDGLIGGLAGARQRALALVAVQAGEQVLIVGAGTGEDLQYLPPDASVTATDLTPAMVARIQHKAEQLQRHVTATVMDGQALTLPDHTFDVVILNLIVAVIPDPVACLREAARVLKPEGRILIFDKFLADQQRPSLFRRLLNGIMRVAATNINRQLRPLSAQAALCIVHEEKGTQLAGIDFIIALLKKCPPAG